jgi:CxxC motif-containing protein (DUF1111 family)
MHMHQVAQLLSAFAREAAGGHVPETAAGAIPLLLRLSRASFQAGDRTDLSSSSSSYCPVVVMGGGM